MAISIEESIQRLKAEIIAQDWRLSPRRAEQLSGAFSCLKQRFKTRRATHAMLVMADSVLAHIMKNGADPPETIDFIKEAMAHVVDLYEDLSFDPEKEDKVFKRLFKRFDILKKEIKNRPKSAAKEVKEQPRDLPLSKPLLAEITKDDSPRPSVPEPPSAASDHTKSPPLPPGQENLTEDVQKLIADLKTTLDRAGEVGSAISRIFGEIIEAQHRTASIPPGEDHIVGSAPISVETPSQPSATAPQPEPARVEPDQESVSTEKPELRQQEILSCQATELKEITINDSKVALRDHVIALVRPAKQAKVKTYIKNSNVPLKDFCGLFQKLSSQFSGNLAKIKDSKLKQLNLPIMVPAGLNLPEAPDDKATKLVFISNGDWHGVIACSSIEEKPVTMVKFEKAKNGDIAGYGYLEDDKQVILLDTLSILRREGFLFMA